MLDNEILVEENTDITVCLTSYIAGKTPYIDYGGLIPLYKGDINCVHEIVGGDNFSGIKCRKCKGWYCA